MYIIMYMYMYICIYVYVYMYICICICIFTRWICLCHFEAKSTVNRDTVIYDDLSIECNPPTLLKTSASHEPLETHPLDWTSRLTTNKFTEESTVAMSIHAKAWQGIDLEPHPTKNQALTFCSKSHIWWRLSQLDAQQNVSIQVIMTDPIDPGWSSTACLGFQFGICAQWFARGILWCLQTMSFWCKRTRTIVVSSGPRFWKLGNLFRRQGVQQASFGCKSSLPGKSATSHAECAKRGPDRAGILLVSSLLQFENIAFPKNASKCNCSMLLTSPSPTPQHGNSLQAHYHYQVLCWSWELGIVWESFVVSECIVFQGFYHLWSKSTSIQHISKHCIVNCRAFHESKRNWN